ncbi:MAG: hypothetical protein AB7E10_03765 [Burkholderiaceae bacterium]
MSAPSSYVAVQQNIPARDLLCMEIFCTPEAKNLPEYALLVILVPAETEGIQPSTSLYPDPKNPTQIVH